MKTILLVCALAATAIAAPRLDRATRLDVKLSEHVRIAEEAWTAAAREADPRKQAALWEAAAAAFAAVDSDAVDASVKREAARAAVLASANAGGKVPAAARERYRKYVEDLEADARATQDAAKHLAAATAYLELYNATPDAGGGDELIYNAGVSFEAAGAVSGALQTYALAERMFPRSRLTPFALGRAARIYVSIGMFEQAAEKFEMYARKYAAEKDAPDAASNAVSLRTALGDRDKAIEDTRYFIRTYGAKRSHEAADAAWSLVALYDAEPDAAIAALREYLRTYATKGGDERVVVAHAKLGELLWQKSCPVRAVDGLCATADERTARTCGSGVARTWLPRTREPAIRNEALAEFARAIGEYERHPPDVASARYEYAQAKLAVVDAELETYLGLAFPPGLSFDPANAAARATSMKRFTAWTDQKQKAATTLTRRYEDILAVKDVVSSIAAAERLGLVAQSDASSLVTGTLARDVTTGPHAADKRKAYCDTITTFAGPIEARARDTFGVCLAKSTQLGWFDDRSRMCEQELARLDPREFPPAIEHRAPALFSAPVITDEPASR
jgi:hypothetical protein